MSKYYEVEKANKLSYDQMVIARCPNWCDTGYQVCKWDGKEFYYGEQSNDMFNGDVIAFMPLNNDGEPCLL